MHIIRQRRRMTSGAARSRSRRVIAGGLALAALTATSFVTADAAPGKADLAQVDAAAVQFPSDLGERIRTGIALAKVRIATVKYHRIEMAEKAGYQLGYIEPFLLDHCIAHPTAGAMGYHWFDHDAIHDIELDALRPEGLVYAPGPNGRLRLAAVEWIVPVTAWEAAGNIEPPSVLGQKMHVLNPALGWYILHAWVWKYNPSGVFEDWNPNVVCP